MLSEYKRGKLFARRAFIIGSFKAALMSSLIARLYYLQIIKADEYKTISDSNRIKLFMIPSLRGKILDKDGEVIADNQNYYRVLFDPERASREIEILDNLVRVLRLDEEEKLRVQKILKKNRSRNPVVLYDSLTWDQVARFEGNSTDLPGAFIDVGQARHYPSGAIAAHLIGTLGPVPEEDIKQNPLLNHPDYKVGKSGVEKLYDYELRGKVGVKRVEVNAFGMQVRELSREESIAGENVNLTLSSELQQFVDKRMETTNGSVVVIDVRSGAVLAMTSSPYYDPNKFAYKVDPKYWRELNTNPDKPLINKITHSQYPPGSTFKMIVALAALEFGISPLFQVNCTGAVYLGSAKFRCWKDGGHGVVNMRSAISHSCDSYFYRVAQRIGVDNIAKIAVKFGLGDVTNIGLPGEKPGLVPTTSWKQKRYNIKWQAGDTFNVGIGQGYVLTTPLQLAVMAARIASGNKIIPKIRLSDTKDVSFSSIGIPKEHMDIVRGGMIDVVNMPGGTAQRSKIDEPGYSMAGKTGTVQVISKKAYDILKHKVTPDQLRRLQNHAFFVGYGPVTNPAVAVSVFVEHGGSGSGAAAPIAKDVVHLAEKILNAKDEGF